ncbi:MAG: NgoPII family restriction endonuclease [Paludibacteraceae bacterium]|nr:NgoPII family restriction endonuclease [Paludibacteraceae bacterium]
MSNIITAIINIISSQTLPDRVSSNNRANQMGEALEEYVKDIFANTQGEKDESIRNNKFEQTFSYLGNQNNPPDLMLINGGDAVEVKKIESFSSALALNSSYPKEKLYSNSTLINNACRTCEEWEERDMLYVVGVVKNGQIKAMALVYGEDYCASKEIYERIKNKIKDGINEIHGVEFAVTNELGRVNRVDPLGITYLRVRGMWHIENPFTVFNYVYKLDTSKSFNLMAILNKEKIRKTEDYQRIIELSKKNKCIEVKDIEIKDPNNPAKLKDAVLITYSI